MNRPIFIIILTMFVLVLGLTYKQIEICCAYNATKYYGWPFSFIALTTTTRDYAEAQRIHHDSATTLLNDGWTLEFQSPDGSSNLPNIALSPFVAFGADVLFSASLAFLIVEGSVLIKKRKK